MGTAAFFFFLFLFLLSGLQAQSPKTDSLKQVLKTAKNIRYAKRIQQALMPSEKYIAKNINHLKRSNA